MISIERRMMTIELNDDVYYEYGKRNYTILEVQKLLIDIQSKYPDKKIIIEFYDYEDTIGVDEFNDRKIFMTFYYERLETNEEYNKRIDLLTGKERIKKEQDKFIKEIQENSDRLLYNKFKEKYGW